jgi:hypothetical protein
MYVFYILVYMSFCDLLGSHILFYHAFLYLRIHVI